MLRFIFLVFVMVFLSSCDGSDEETYAEMKKVDFNCPENSEVETSRWGEYGLLRECKTKNGKWQAWREERLKVDGHYVDNKKHGEWIWYDDSGRIEKKLVYEHGTEISQ